MTPADRDFYEVVCMGLLVPLACLLACYGVRWRKRREWDANEAIPRVIDESDALLKRLADADCQRDLTDAYECRKDLLRRLAKGRPE